MAIPYCAARSQTVGVKSAVACGRRGGQLQASGKTNRNVHAIQRDRLLLCRLRIIEGKRQPPVIEDGRQQHDVLRSPPIPNGVVRVPGEHRVGEDDRATTFANPGIESHVFGGCKSARLSEHDALQPGQRFCLERIERHHRQARLHFLPHPVGLRRSIEHGAERVLPPIDRQGREEPDIGLGTGGLIPCRDSRTRCSAQRQRQSCDERVNWAREAHRPRPSVRPSALQTASRSVARAGRGPHPLRPEGRSAGAPG